MVRVQNNREFLDRLAAACPPHVEAILAHYRPGLIGLAFRELSRRKLQGCVPAEDVVQITSWEFVLHLRENGYRFVNLDAVQALLATFTRNEVRNQARQHYAARRDVRRVVPFEETAAGDTRGQAPAGHGDDPFQTAAAHDQLASLLQDLPDLHRHIVRSRVAGHTIEEIATLQGCSDRLVNKVLAAARRKLAGLITD